MAQRCLMGVFAHPDDEGSMAGAYRMYHDAGVRTVLVCATRGEEGEISDPALATRETLGRVREGELREACRILGMSELSFLDYHDGRLAEADPDEATGRIVRQMRRHRPQVVVTFDANGGYGHRDHIAVHHLTNAAFARSGDPMAFPEQLAEGLAPHAPQKLYYVAFPRAALQSLWDYALREQPDLQPFGAVATIPMSEMGNDDADVTTVIPLDDALYAVREAMMQAHRTQMSPSGPFAHVPPEVMRVVWGRNYFVRAVPPASPGEASEDDLFVGVETGVEVP